MKERTETLAMFGLLAYVSILLAVAQEPDIIDLGVFTPRIGIALDRIDDRKDFKEFRIEFLPQNPPTNMVAITHTNDLLTVADVAMLPSGPTIMGVRSVAMDGSESPVSLYRFDLRRAGPPAPMARPIHIAAEEPERSTTNALRRVIERRATHTPALPPMPAALKATLPGPIPPASRWPKALPEGDNRSYAEGQDAKAASMERHYNRPGRRNE